MQNRVIITIPIHKSSLSHYETISFRQCFSIFFRRKIYLIAPVDLDIAEYVKLIPDINVIRVNSKWLSSIEMYNKFKLSNYFYSLFESYEYILTYELDSFVFRDELDYWVEQDFDYIGAPWFEGFSEDDTYIFNGVGNSGFSLRNVKKMQEILSDYKTPFYEPNKLKKYIKNVYGFINFLIDKENYFLQNSKGFNEDSIIYSLRQKKNIKIPNESIALKFSFEVHPSYLYKLNNFQLPMGCHGWEKYEKTFWETFVKT